MRKLCSLGVLALLLSVLSSPVVAAVEHCDELKGENQTKGLYGMCVAYWSANEKHRQRFLDKYDAIIEMHGGPPMPGLPQGFQCPCWQGHDTVSVKAGAVSSSSTFGYFSSVTFFSDVSKSKVVRLFMAGSFSCGFTDDPLKFPSLVADPEDVCLGEVVKISNISFE